MAMSWVQLKIIGQGPHVFLVLPKGYVGALVTKLLPLGR
jgi:hypothetical protein